MRLPNMRVTAQLMSPSGQIDPLHLTPEFHILVEVEGLPGPIQFSERITEISLLTKGVFSIIWDMMGKEISSELERMSQ